MQQTHTEAAKASSPTRVETLAHPHQSRSSTPPAMEPPKHTLEDIQGRPDNLWYRLHVLAYDLRHFAVRENSQGRLGLIVEPSYIGAPYFSEEEATTIRALDVHGQSLEQVIARTLDEHANQNMKKRVESGDYSVCAAHSVAPVIERALKISPRNIAMDAHFLDLVEQRGLELKQGEVWQGLRKRRHLGAQGGRDGRKNGGKLKKPVYQMPCHVSQFCAVAQGTGCTIQ